MNKHRFWPVTLSGAFGVFLAGFMFNDLLEELIKPEDGKWLFPAIMVWLTLHHAAGTARGAVLTGTYILGWWGIRTSTSVTETVVSAPKPPKK